MTKFVQQEFVYSYDRLICL